MKSGKPFRRKSLGTAFSKFQKPNHHYVLQFTDEDILADDWEIEEEKKVEVTRTQLEDAIRGTSYIHHRLDDFFLQNVFKELGLE